MELTFVERLHIFQLFPQKGNIVSMRLVKDISKKVEFTEEEKARYGLLYHPDGRVEWKPTGDVFGVEFNKPEVEFLQDRVRELNATNNITFNILELCEKLQKVTFDTPTKE